MICRRCGAPIGDPAIHELNCDARPISHAVALPDDREPTINDVLGALGSVHWSPVERMLEDWAIDPSYL